MSPSVAGCGLRCRSAAGIMVGCGLARPCACGRWLPVWLPEISLAVLTFEQPDSWYNTVSSVTWLLGPVLWLTLVRSGYSGDASQV